MEVTTVILSHKRAGRVTTHRYVSGAQLCVPESQADQYAKFHPADRLLVHPDSVVGLCAKRQWLYKQVGNVMMLDDDSTGLYRLYYPRGGATSNRRRFRCSAERAADIIQATARTAKALGAYLFGFASHCNPLTYYPTRPFVFGGYTPGGSVGLLEGADLWWPDDCVLPVDDWWICLLNTYKHRYAFYDRRFAWAFRLTYRGQGGMAEFRHEGAEREATEYLVRYFGGDIVVPKHTPPSVTRRKFNPSPRRIRLPWRT